MKKLCYVATIPAVVHAFLRPHIHAASEKYQVTVICNEADKHLLQGVNARIIFLPIERNPTPLRDLRILWQLFILFRREQFDIVHSIMPKTGMLAMGAAWLSCVPVRIHTFTGQVWVTKQGMRRKLLKLFDRLIAKFATCALADSPSQRDFLISQNVLPIDKATVIGAGSICGVDSLRFHSDEQNKHNIRKELGIAIDAKIILFVGRLNRDKGMLDLAAAFNELSRYHQNVALLLVGAEEDVSLGDMQKICTSHPQRIHHVKFTATPENYMAAADIFCLPSYREGFGLTIIEAAACGLPTVATRIYGITDAVLDGETGLLFETGQVNQLIAALQKLLVENELRKTMGDAARTRVLAVFSSASIAFEMVQLYDRLSGIKHVSNDG